VSASSFSKRGSFGIRKENLKPREILGAKRKKGRKEENKDEATYEDQP